MKLLRSVKRDLDKDKDREHVPKLESVKVVLVYCNLVNNSYQQVLKALFTFAPKKQFGQLNTTSPLQIKNRRQCEYDNNHWVNIH